MLALGLSMHARKGTYNSRATFPLMSYTKKIVAIHHSNNAMHGTLTPTVGVSGLRLKFLKLISMEVRNPQHQSQYWMYSVTREL